ncbi:MAG: hypothetical protein HKP25_02930 [Marinicaulis sp.]|nr:hypothetical protein [Marinicaulis sp.]
MTNLLKAAIAGATALFALGLTAASADRGDRRDYRPDYCKVDHDHRSHASNYYDYYPADRYYRGGKYRDSGVSLSITVGNDGYRDRRYNDRRYRDRGYRNGYRGRDGRVINRQVYDTRHRARIVLVEEVVRTRRGPRLYCTVEARGRDRHYVSKKRLRRIANRDCSPRARVRVYT